jgi:transcriptional antiterminator NusG
MFDNQYKWYIVHTSASAEKKVKKAILENSEKKNLTEMFAEIVVPSLEVSKMRRGKEVVVDKKIIPGYVLIKMILDENSWQLVKSIPQVTNFLGDGVKPLPVPESEVMHILDQLKLKSQDSIDAKSYDVGEVVQIIDGPFDSFSGVVDEVDYAKGRLKVSVSIFGRSTPIDLNFAQVQKSSRL